MRIATEDEQVLRNLRRLLQPNIALSNTLIHNKQNSYDLEAFRTDGNLEKTSLETGSLGYTVDVATDPCKRRLICLRAVSRRGKLYTLSQRLDDIEFERELTTTTASSTPQPVVKIGLNQPRLPRINYVAPTGTVPRALAQIHPNSENCNDVCHFSGQTVCTYV